MQDDPEKNYNEWLKKAEEDEFAAKVILDGEHFPAPGCFHTHQMVEKYLKGLLVFHGKGFPKVHDLLELESMLLEVEPDIREFVGTMDPVRSPLVQGAL